MRDAKKICGTIQELLIRNWHTALEKRLRAMERENASEVCDLFGFFSEFDFFTFLFSLIYKVRNVADGISVGKGVNSRGRLQRVRGLYQ